MRHLHKNPGSPYERMNIRYTLVILIVLLWNNTCSAQATDSAKVINTIIKCWRATSHEYSTIYALEEEEIKKYSKQKICFTRDSITMYNGVYFAPKFSIKKVNTEDYAKNSFDCKKDKLGILEDSVYEITISSVTRPTQNEPAHKMTDIIAFDGYYIYIANDGVIFKLFDSEAKVGGRGAN